MRKLRSSEATLQNPNAEMLLCRYRGWCILFQEPYRKHPKIVFTPTMTGTTAIFISQISMIDRFGCTVMEQWIADLLMTYVNLGGWIGHHFLIGSRTQQIRIQMFKSQEESPQPPAPPLTIGATGQFLSPFWASASPYKMGKTMQHVKWLHVKHLINYSNAEKQRIPNP